MHIQSPRASRGQDQSDRALGPCCMDQRERPMNASSVVIYTTRTEIRRLTLLVLESHSVQIRSEPPP